MRRDFLQTYNTIYGEWGHAQRNDFHYPILVFMLDMIH